MFYDPSKYRHKREKVLGVRKKGLGFGKWAVLVSLAILLSLGTVVAPRVIAYFATRGLDDAIFKLTGSDPVTVTMVDQLIQQTGIKNALNDKNGERLIVTFARRTTDPTRIAAFLSSHGIEAVLLNRIDHRQRNRTLREEAEI
jgi:hypothetical protein